MVAAGYAVACQVTSTDPQAATQDDGDQTPSTPPPAATGLIVAPNRPSTPPSALRFAGGTGRASRSRRRPVPATSTYST